MRENSRNALEREKQHLNDRLLATQNGEREGIVEKSDTAVTKGKVVLEKATLDGMQLQMLLDP
jgi:hypothetical protein